jgi:hypothetical protein
MPDNRTPLSNLPDEYFFYIKGGQGRLDDGKQHWDLREDTAILAPPNVPHRFINTSDKSLSMIMLTWPSGPDAHKEPIVRDVNLLPWCEDDNGHGAEEIWNNVTPGTTIALLGSELREMPEDSAYLVPPTGITDHSNINISKDRVDWWIYVARGPAPAPGATPTAGRGGRGGGRGAANPNLSRDVAEATIPGKPLQ